MCVMHPRSPSIELVVFDFDGTILDTEWPHFTAVRDTFVRYGAELTLDQWQHRVGRADHPHWSTLLADALGAASMSGNRVKVDLDAMIAECRARKDAATLAELVRPGVIELFDRAEQAGVAIAVASSSPRDWVEPNLERLGLLGRVHAVRRGASSGGHRGLALWARGGSGGWPSVHRRTQSGHDGPGLRLGLARGGVPGRGQTRHVGAAVGLFRACSDLAAAGRPDSHLVLSWDFIRSGPLGRTLTHALRGGIRRTPCGFPIEPSTPPPSFVLGTSSPCSKPPDCPARWSESPAPPATQGHPRRIRTRLHRPCSMIETQQPATKVATYQSVWRKIADDDLANYLQLIIYVRD